MEAPDGCRMGTTGTKWLAFVFVWYSQQCNVGSGTEHPTALRGILASQRGPCHHLREDTEELQTKILWYCASALAAHPNGNTWLDSSHLFLHFSTYVIALWHTWRPRALVLDRIFQPVTNIRRSMEVQLSLLRGTFGIEPDSFPIDWSTNPGSSSKFPFKGSGSTKAASTDATRRACAGDTSFVRLPRAPSITFLAPSASVSTSRAELRLARTASTIPSREKTPYPEREVVGSSSDPRMPFRVRKGFPSGSKRRFERKRPRF